MSHSHFFLQVYFQEKAYIIFPETYSDRYQRYHNSSNNRSGHLRSEDTYFNGRRIIHKEIFFFWVYQKLKYKNPQQIKKKKQQQKTNKQTNEQTSKNELNWSNYYTNDSQIWNVDM